MTVIGIGGCTALIIAGFGMRSSLLFTMSRQYDELFHYSAQVTLADNALPEERAAVEDFLAGDSRVVNYIPLCGLVRHGGHPPPIQPPPMSR